MTIRFFPKWMWNSVISANSGKLKHDVNQKILSVTFVKLTPWLSWFLTQDVADSNNICTTQFARKFSENLGRYLENETANFLAMCLSNQMTVTIFMKRTT